MVNGGRYTTQTHRVTRDNYVGDRKAFNFKLCHRSESGLGPAVIASPEKPQKSIQSWVVDE